MVDPQFHLAEFNVSRLLAPLDSPLTLLEELGPTKEAFTFQDAFDSAGTPLPKPARPGQGDAP